MNKVFILISFFLITTTSKAQENKTYKFTLEQAINFALDSNYTAINARRDIAKAIKKKWETTASGLPQLNGSISYQNNLKLLVVLQPYLDWHLLTSAYGIYNQDLKPYHYSEISNR